MAALGLTGAGRTRPAAVLGANMPAMPTATRWRGRLSLRARATVGFAVTALVVAVGLAVITYSLARSYLVDQREDAAVSQGYVNARLVRSVLRASDPDVKTLLASLGGATASDSVLRYRDQWFATSVTFSPDALPADLVRAVADGHAGHQRYRDTDGQLRMAVGVPIATAGASYFEVFALNELDNTLDVLARTLAIGVVVAALVAGLVGRAAASRLVRPLAPIADAAEQIASGALDTRLTHVADPELQRLSDAFNAMAEALEARIDREARFAADVSHELRSPLTAVAAAMEIIERRRAQLPPEIADAYRVLHEKLELFQRTVLELLEISRIDAGTAVLAEDPIDLEHLLTRVLELHGADEATVTFAPGAPTRILADRRRLAQAMGNIVDNARRYAGGVTAVEVAKDDDSVRLTFDDRGHGVPLEERDAIFGRFARGHEGRRAGSSSGTGLGLSLVAEHIRLHGGSVRVEDSPAGGARFVIELPERTP